MALSGVLFFVAGCAAIVALFAVYAWLIRGLAAESPPQKPNEFAKINELLRRLRDVKPVPCEEDEPAHPCA